MSHKREHTPHRTLSLPLVMAALLTVMLTGGRAQADPGAEKACAAMDWEIDGCELDRRDALEIYCITEGEYDFLKRTNRVPLCNEYAEHVTDCDCNESAARKRRRLAAERKRQAERERRLREAERLAREEARRLMQEHCPPNYFCH